MRYPLKSWYLKANFFGFLKSQINFRKSQKISHSNIVWLKSSESLKTPRALSAPPCLFFGRGVRAANIQSEIPKTMLSALVGQWRKLWWNILHAYFKCKDAWWFSTIQCQPNAKNAFNNLERRCCWQWAVQRIYINATHFW